MITTFLVAHPWLPATALAVLIVLGTPAALWLSSRPGLARVCLALSLLPVAALTMAPTGLPAYPGCEVAFWLPMPGRVELTANVVLFVGPALLGGVVLRAPALALLAASAGSVVVEVVQLTVAVLGRSCSTNDWLSNTIGAAVGAVLAWLVLAVASWWSPARSGRSSRVTRPVA